MGDRIFRIFNPKGHSEDPVEKRRGQLRRAQQTYRDRKDKYTKSLEAEVARSRADERRLKRSLQQLRDTVDILIGVLAQHGIPIPATVRYGDALDETSRIPAKITTTPPLPAKDPFSLQRSPESATENVGVDIWERETAGETRHDLHLGRTVPQNMLVDLTSEIAKEPTNQHIHRDTPVLNLGLQHEISNVSASMITHDGIQLCQLDTSIVGMEFVLALEQPCLGHLFGDPNNPDEPNYHTLTASAQLQFCASPSTPEEKRPVVPSIQEDREIVLERLLTLAPDVCSEDEVTPVQAWNYIRSRPLFGGLRVQDLRVFVGKLREAVICHGFGAVVQKGVLENVVFETLIVGRPL